MQSFKVFKYLKLVYAVFKVSSVDNFSPLTYIYKLKHHSSVILKPQIRIKMYDTSID